MKRLLFALLMPLLAWGDIFLLDGELRVKLASVDTVKLDAEALNALPHVRRNDPTITLEFTGEEYNHRHLNVRLATLEAHPLHTVLTEYSEQIGEQSYRVTFSGYRFCEARMLQVFYCGEWFAVVLEALEDKSACNADKTSENAAPDDQPSEVLSYDQLDHLLDQLGR